MSAKFPYDVFLSHNHADKPRVRRLVPVSQLSTGPHRRPPRPGPCGLPVHPAPAGRLCFPDTLRRYKVVDFREESEAAFAEVLATRQAETAAMKRRMVALPGQIFYSTQIPVCLGFILENGNAGASTFGLN